MPVRTGDLLRIGDLDVAGIERLLDLAARMGRTSTSWIVQFRGQALACFFDDPHAEARIPADVAAARLGLVPLVLRSQDLESGVRPVGEVARSLSGQVAAIFTRGLCQEVLEQMAAAAHVPVVNARSDIHDPCQALADLVTLRQCFGELRGLRIAYVGPSGPGLHSLIEAVALTGMELRLACPSGQGPDSAVEESARRVAAATGARILVADDATGALTDADVVYAGAWPDAGPGGGHEHRRVVAESMRMAAPGVLLMHADARGAREEIAQGLGDRGRSAPGRQGANRIPVHQAVLCDLISANRGELLGRAGRAGRAATRNDEHRAGGGAHEAGRGAAEQGAPNRTVSA